VNNIANSEVENLKRVYRYYRVLSLITLTGISLIAGCLEENLIYPEIISGNTFRLPDRWEEKYISCVEVYRMSGSSSGTLSVPVWTLRATERVPANRVIFAAGIIPHGFEQTIPELPEQFRPEEGEQYYIKVLIEPADSNTISVLRPWRASAIPGPNSPNDVQPYIHKASKMEFPPYVGLFSKREVTLFDKMGQDISVEYIQRALGCITTVYIYPATDLMNRPVDMKMHFDQIEAAIRSSYGEVSAVTRGETVLEQDGSTYHGLHSAFAMIWQSSRGNVRVFSDLYLFRHGRWFIKYRFTYPRDSRRSIEEQIDQFMESLEWPDVSTPL